MKFKYLAVAPVISTLFCFNAKAAETLRPIFDGASKLEAAPEEVNATHEAIALAPIVDPVLPEPQSKPKEEEKPVYKEPYFRDRTKTEAAQGGALIGGITGAIIGGTLAYIGTVGSPWIVAAMIGGIVGGGMVGAGALAGLFFITIVGLNLIL